MLFCGVPIFLQEVAIGQYLGAGGMTMIAKICPILKGNSIDKYILGIRSELNLWLKPEYWDGKWFGITSILGVGIATMVMVTYYNIYYCIIVKL